MTAIVSAILGIFSFTLPSTPPSVNKNEKVTIQEVAKNIEKRDFEDSNREISPLIKPKNAIEIDNSLLTIQETLSSSMHFINAYFLTNN